MNMNINPWVIQALVEYQTERVERDIERARLEEEAREAGRLENKAKARVPLSHLFMRIMLTVAKRMFGADRGIQRYSSEKQV